MSVKWNYHDFKVSIAHIALHPLGYRAQQIHQYQHAAQKSHHYQRENLATHAKNIIIVKIISKSHLSW